jgi:hypothetical protein
VSGARTTPERSGLAARHGRLSIFGVFPPRGEASAITTWRLVRDSEEALRAITAPSFDASTTAILEEDHGVSLARPVGTRDQARAPALGYVLRGPQEAEIDVSSDQPVLVVVRTPYDRNWRATVDGRDAPVVPADYLIQAVPVPPGSHTVRLTYEDPSIGAGLIGSLASVTALGILAVVMRLRSRIR